MVFWCDVRRGVNGDDGSGGSSREGDRFGGGSGGNAGVISAEGGASSDGIVHRQRTGGGTGSAEGEHRIGGAVF